MSLVSRVHWEVMSLPPTGYVCVKSKSGVSCLFVRVICVTAPPRAVEPIKKKQYVFVPGHHTMFLDYPDSQNALQELHQCLEKTGQWQLVLTLRQALETRLLHPGMECYGIGRTPVGLVVFSRKSISIYIDTCGLQKCLWWCCGYQGVRIKERENCCYVVSHL